MTEIKNEGLNRPKYVAFSTQKGGAGKTTITVLVASYLHYVKDCNVAIIDCDYPQFSASDLRKRDREKMLSLLATLRARLDEINDGSFAVVDYETPYLLALERGNLNVSC